jgi:hypothetical protein
MLDTLYDADFPALQTLLGKGRRLTPAGASIDAWWCAHFGIGLEEFAAAPLRLSAAGRDAGDSTWLCADPVHLQANQGGAVLKDPASFHIDAEEAAQLHAMLAPLFAAVGELVVTTPSQWHLRLATPSPDLPANLHDFIEQSAMALLPSGDEGRRWRQLLNEVQMSLHAHPLNTERSARGQAEINSIALWGGGRTPTLQARTHSAIFSDDPIVIGAGRLTGLPVQPLPACFSSSAADRIVHWNLLQAPAASHDAQAWRDGLQRLDNDWLAPALAALASGVLKRIELHGFGDEEPVSISMTALDRYRFWRKPRRLETL